MSWICYHFLDPQPPGSLEACPGLYTKSFIFYIIQINCTSYEINKVTYILEMPSISVDFCVIEDLLLHGDIRTIAKHRPTRYHNKFPYNKYDFPTD